MSVGHRLYLCKLGRRKERRGHRRVISMLKRLIFYAILAFELSGTAFAQSTTNVTTHHNDNLRTGWNSTEIQLTPASVSPTTFGLIANVPVDEQVDAQPLV